MLAAIATLVLVQMMGFGVQGFAGFNLILVGVWLVIAVALFRENRRLTSESPKQADAP
jgi:hypothetical protein